MFEGVGFRGVFRDYQQKILDGADGYLDDGKINVVAAPGSGKTILGLELIRRLGKPCIILSPTTTIRDQWGQRFSENFMPDGAEPSDFVSYNLRKCSVITSITYQALYSAVEKVECKEGDEEDYSDVDIFKTVNLAGVETVCLDEAHHLQNEWQRALERFLKRLEGKVKIISLTATPPYDASPAEWKRYTEVCGEIDEEIFVPELVKRNTLCPHQDYVYFNYPRESETEDLKKYRERVSEAVDETFSSGILCDFCRALEEKCADETFAFSNVKEINATLALFEAAGTDIGEKLERMFPNRGKKQRKLDLQSAETCLNFLISSQIADAETTERLVSFYLGRKLLVHGKICLDLTDKLKRTLIASAGKLESIAEIARSESAGLGGKLRLLVLTDFIRRESISAVVTDIQFCSVSVISVFETVRKAVGAPVGALSGSLVILPLSCEQSLKERGAKFSIKPVNAEGYGEFVFQGGNKEKVGHVGALFEKGEINVLVGTKSLLGEGWDSPCINALILASFVGSFMLSNQMRGRAIRVDRNSPDKTANIWHLVTLEPPHILKDGKIGRKIAQITESKSEIISCDYETVARRFNCFVAPSYDTGVIESGIERVSIIKPPFDEKNVENINRQMCERAADRGKLKEIWENAVQGSGCISEMTDIPKERKFPAFNFKNVGLWFIILGIAVGLSSLVLVGCILPSGEEPNILLIAAGAVAAFVLYVIAMRLGYRLLVLKNPKRSVKFLAEAVLRTLKELYLVDANCRLKVSVSGEGTDISAGLANASERDGKLFQNAVGELFSAIDNPRYVLIPKNFLGKYNYFCALACPSVFGAKKEYAGQFVRNVKKTLGRLELVYTRGDGGQKILALCRNISYINFNYRMIRKVQRL